jgi:hypothetical protein
MVPRLLTIAWLATAVVPLAAQPAADASSGAAVKGTGDARIERLVFEDDRARIDELRVRGQAQRIVVQPKNSRLRAYEVITGDGSRDLSPGHGSSRAAAGQRVWPVLAF